LRRYAQGGVEYSRLVQAEADVLCESFQQFVLTYSRWLSCTTKVLHYRPAPNSDESYSSNKLQGHYIKVSRSLIADEHSQSSSNTKAEAAAKNTWNG
jgi:hypothetical protein